MGLVQYIYTSILLAEMTPQDAFDTGSLSVSLCQKFGITGRVFANRQQALAITEGPEEAVSRYLESIRVDPLASKVLFHSQRPIQKREFPSYSVWLNLGESSFPFDENIRHLTAESLKDAWPANLSTKIRIMADAYLSDDLLGSQF